MSTDTIKPKPRYYILRDELKYFWLKSEGEVPAIQRFKRHSIECKDNKVFLDILGEDIDGVFRQVKLYLDNGQTQVCFIPTTYYNFINIENMDHLFDGRFNA